MTARRRCDTVVERDGFKYRCKWTKGHDSPRSTSPNKEHDFVAIDHYELEAVSHLRQMIETLITSGGGVRA